ncbi:protein disulfide [Tothia fuscella]|uniref:Protein disulfide n=1 Tax=Tothia fuscella TaxID=1048955 RepID=A0A9P4TSF9_9PEZI|nr:protein disulfide [Tothia fuscella]
MPTKEHNVEFYYDISCPFAYIALLRIEALASRINANIIWTPVLLGAVYRLTAAPQGAAGSASDVFNPAKRQISSASFARTLKRYHVPHNPALTHLRKTTTALRLILDFPNEDRPALTKALYKAYWVDAKDITDHNVLLDIARQSGIASAQALTMDIFYDETDRKELERAANDVIAKGSPGVPAFWVEDEVYTDGKGTQHQGRLYWGQDRMLFVEAQLKALQLGVSFSAVPNISSLHPRVIWKLPDPIARSAVKLEFWFDFSSPWAFLGWTQLNSLRKMFGSRLEIVMKPILLGALSREIGAPMMPMMAVSEQKRNQGYLDMVDWVRYWNAVHGQERTMDKRIEFRFTDTFPIRSPVLLRCAIVDPGCIPVIYRACWEENLDIADERILAGKLASAGIDAASLFAQASTQRVKDILRVNTQEAKDLGICGVPSYRVSYGNADDWPTKSGILWGQDEMNVVKDLLAGWNEEKDYYSVARVRDNSDKNESKEGAKL